MLPRAGHPVARAAHRDARASRSFPSKCPRRSMARVMRRTLTRSPLSVPSRRDDPQVSANVPGPKSKRPGPPNHQYRRRGRRRPDSWWRWSCRSRVSSHATVLLPLPPLEPTLRQSRAPRPTKESPAESATQTQPVGKRHRADRRLLSQLRHDRYGQHSSLLQVRPADHGKRASSATRTTGATTPRAPSAFRTRPTCAWRARLATAWTATSGRHTTRPTWRSTRRCRSVGVCVAYGCHVGTKKTDQCFNCHHVLHESGDQWKTEHPAVVAATGDNACLETCHHVEQCQQCHTTGKSSPCSTG